MPEIFKESGRNLPHHEYITQVVTALEASGATPMSGGWRKAPPTAPLCRRCWAGAPGTTTARAILTPPTPTWCSP
ncbi:hypothetical protein GCM10010430_74800 [Kitasatospora cystarginea]|uniref:Uncharacterized protein n=1 Tax=Kitasatospora cystarginea TaxID=58350 RepID=A0ABN3EZZ3_9ACTN